MKKVFIIFLLAVFLTGCANKESKQEEVNSSGEIVEINNYFSKDNESVYFENQKMYQSDANTFELLEKNYAKDKNNVYLYNPKIAILENADPESFQILKNDYSKDKNNVYLMKDKIRQYDAETFEVLEQYTKDKNGVYYKSRMLPNVDLESFEDISKSLNYAYGKDNEHVFFRGSLIENANPETFEIYEAFFVDKGDYKAPTYNYVKDKNNVYYCNEELEMCGVIPNVNPKNYQPPVE